MVGTSTHLFVRVLEVDVDLDGDLVLLGDHHPGGLLYITEIQGLENKEEDAK